MVGDGHAMGVAAEILQDIWGATEGAFQVDHPVLSVAWSQPGGEGLGLSKKLQVSIEAELAILKSPLESVDELAAKNFLQHFLGKKVVVSGANPASVIWRKATGWHDTMDMRMSGELLAPGSKMSHAALGG